MNFKKSFFGGYNKADVDAFIEERNKKIDNLKEKESTLSDTIAHKNSEVASLSSEIEKLKSEIEKINAENNALKIEANKSHLIFENVAKIYERAYDAGHNIVLDSKTHSEQMMDHMNQLFYTASNNVNETITKQENLKQELTSLYAKINSIITELTNNTNALFKGAEEYISVFEVFENIKTNTDENTKTQLKEFEDFASEFLTAEEIKKSNTFTKITDNALPTYETEVEEIVSPATQTEEIVESVVTEIKEDIVFESEETSLSQPEENDETDLLNEEKPEESPDDIIQDEAPTDIEINVIPIEKPQEPEIPAYVKQEKTQEFTQFGRKSRVSSESREELIRKALLKNGGM